MKRKRARSKKKLVLLGLFLAIILSLFVIVRFNIFVIKSVEISLDKISCVSSEQIKNSSKLLGQNFFLINSSKVENDLKNKFICIGKVGLSRIFPNKIKLNILSRKQAAVLVILSEEQASDSATPSAVLRGDEKKFVVDNEGVIYSSSIEQISAPTVYVTGIELSLGQKVRGNIINNTLKIIGKIQSFGLELADAEIYSNMFLLVNSRPKMIFLLNDNVDNQIASLQLIYDQAKIDSKALEFIDLRFDKPVVRFAPKKR